MDIKKQIAKITVVSLTGGAIVLGGLGLATTASADDGRGGTGNPVPGVAQNGGPRGPQGGVTGGSSTASVQSFVKTDLRALSAKQIGITEDALTRATSQGKSIAQVASEHGVSFATIKTTLVNAEDADLQAATAAGTVSQDQANQLVSLIPQRVEAFLNQSSGRAGIGRMAAAQPGGQFGGQSGARPAGQAPMRGAMPGR